MQGDGDGACEQLHGVQEEGDMETSGDWEMARVRWVFGERGRETEDGEKGVERELSDHRPVCMRLNVELRRWRTEGRKESRVPRMRWEGLMNEEKKTEYEEKTRQKWESRGEQEWGWSEVAEVLVKTVEEVCGLGNIGVASPWTVGRERERLRKESKGLRRE